MKTRILDALKNALGHIGEGVKPALQPVPVGGNVPMGRR